MSYAVKDWHKYQHYTNRRPPWIKLHRTILDDCDFITAPVASRALAPLVWLLASESVDGTIPSDHEKLSMRLRLPVKEINDGIKGLLAIGYLECLQGASIVLAERKQETRAETEREGEKETEKETEKMPYGELKKVLLSKSEYERLVSKNGTDQTGKAIEILDSYIGSSGKRYKNHYAVLKEGGWVWDRVKATPTAQTQQQSTKPPTVWELTQRKDALTRVIGDYMTKYSLEYDEGRQRCPKAYEKVKAMREELKHLELQIAGVKA